MRRWLACLLALFMLLPSMCLGETVADRYGLMPGGAADQHYTLAEREDISLRVSCDETTVFPGEVVSFIVTVENRSAQPLAGVALSELSIGGGTWEKVPATLPADGSLRTAYTVRIPDQVHDIALFQLQWQGGTMTVQHGLCVVQPLRLTVTSEVKEWPWQAGEEHTVDFTVTNEGDTVLDNVTLTLPGAYLDGRKIGDAVFMRKDRRKLKTAQQTDAFTIENMAPGDSVTMTVVWVPEKLPEGEVTLSMQAAAESDGRMQTRAATAVMARLVERPTMWTTVIRGKVTVGYALCGLAAMTLLTALAALLRARKLR